MKRLWALIFLVFAFGSAQGYYAGGGLGYSSLPQEQPLFFGVHAGYLDGALEFRVGAETNLAYTAVSADVMYAFQFPNARLYVGGGPDALILGTAEVFPAIHTVFGGEYSLGRFGIFAETRAIIPLPLPAPFPSLRLGANVC